MSSQISSSESQDIRNRCKTLPVPTTPGRVTLNLTTNEGGGGNWTKRLFSSVMKSSQSARWDELYSSSPADTTILGRSEEHTSELQSLMRISYAVFCLKKKNYSTPSDVQLA